MNHSGAHRLFPGVTQQKKRKSLQSRQSHHSWGNTRRNTRRKTRRKTQRKLLTNGESAFTIDTDGMEPLSFPPLPTSSLAALLIEPAVESFPPVNKDEVPLLPNEEAIDKLIKETYPLEFGQFDFKFDAVAKEVYEKGQFLHGKMTERERVEGSLFESIDHVIKYNTEDARKKMEKMEKMLEEKKQEQKNLQEALEREYEEKARRSELHAKLKATFFAKSRDLTKSQEHEKEQQAVINKGLKVMKGQLEKINFLHAEMAKLEAKNKKLLQFKVAYNSMRTAVDAINVPK